MEGLSALLKLPARAVRIALIATLLTACGPDNKPVKEDSRPAPVEKPAIPVLEYSLIATLPHDTTSFTEGLFVHEGKLFESTGSPDFPKNLRSLFGVVDLKTGKIDVKAELDKKIYFGEGITVLKNKIYQVTYKNQTGYIYDLRTFNRVGQFGYPNKEGWGLTTDGTYVIMSDGTNNLTFMDPDDHLKVVKVIGATENGYALDALNELEYINGFIYANIWMTDDIAKIDPLTGNVLARINMRPLSYQVKNFHPYALELNGIAYDSAADKIYVTGKLWPNIFQVEFPH